MDKSADLDSPTPISGYSEARPEVLRDHVWRARVARFLDERDGILKAWAAILMLVAVDWLGAWHAGFDIGGMMPAVKGIALFAAFGFVIDFTGRGRQVAEAAHFCALWIAFAVALIIYSYVVATMRLPLRDAEFTRMDLALGFNWGAGFDWVMSSSWSTRWILEHAYNSMMIQVFASIGYFTIIKRSDRSRELLWIGMFATLVSVTLSGPFPALGPFTVGGMPKWSAVLVAIRSGALTKFTVHDVNGIVAFPSVHAVMAVLLVYVHRPPMKTFVPIAMLNLLMLAATPFAGHHYLVDVIAGVSVLAVSIPIMHAAMPRSFAPIEAV